MRQKRAPIQRFGSHSGAPGKKSIQANQKTGVAGIAFSPFPVTRNAPAIRVARL